MSIEKKNLAGVCFRSTLWAVCLLMLILSGTASAKSVYVIASHHAMQFDAWNINPGGTITKQGTYALQWANAPGGVAVHEPSGTIFISSESSRLEWVDNNLQPVGYLSVTQFAGLAVDDKTDVLYAMGRSNQNIYAFDFNPVTKTLTLKAGFPQTLSALHVNSGMGIALDEISSPAILWVADGGNKMIRAYDTATLVEDTTLSFSTASTGVGAVGMGMDRRRGIIYWGSMTYGAWVPPGSGSTYLYKYDIATSTITSQVCAAAGAEVVDVSVNEDTGLVYITETNYISVWDTTTSPWAMLQRHDFGSGRATCGLAVANVSYMPSLAIDKVDDVADDACIGVNGAIQYTVSYSNTGDMDLTGVVITDDLPVEVDLVSAGTGTYDSVTHSVTWSIGDVAQGASGSVQFDVQVNSLAMPGSTIINYATILSNETSLTTVQESTNICTNQPPVAVCQDAILKLDASGQATLTPAMVDGGSYDPDGDPMTLSVSKTVFTCADIGDHTVVLTVTDDSGESDTCEATVTVVDTMDPTIVAPDDIIDVEQENGDGATVELGDVVAQDNCGAVVTNDAPAIFPLGQTVVTWTATDSSGNTATDTQIVEVVDTTPATLSLAEPNPSELWAPNHKFVDVTILGSAQDICDAELDVEVSVEVIDVEGGDGGANHDPDYEVSAIVIEGDDFGILLALRAERSGKGNDRIYRITVSVTDDSGNTAVSTADVTVPHDQGLKNRKR